MQFANVDETGANAKINKDDDNIVAVNDHNSKR